MESLLDQLELQWLQNHASATNKDGVPKKVTKRQKKRLANMAAVEKAGTALVRDSHLRSKTGHQSVPSTSISLPDLPADSRVPSSKSAALLDLQSPSPGFTAQPVNIKLTTDIGRVSPIEEGSREGLDSTLTRVAPLQWSMHHHDLPGVKDSHMDRSGISTTQASGRDFEKYPTVPNMFRFGSSHDLLASLSKGPILQKSREREKHKEADMKSAGVEADLEIGDAREQAQRKADFLTARQDLSNQMNPFDHVHSSSCRQGQAQQEATLSSSYQETGNRQTPFLFTSPTKFLPGDMESTSSLQRFVLGSNAIVPPPAKVESPVTFPSLDRKKTIDAHTFQTAQNSPTFGQYRSKANDSPSTGRHFSSPDDFARVMHGSVKRESSESSIGQRSKKLKVEETG